jgi:integrase
MGVKIRERAKGSGVWWVFVNHKGNRVAKLAGSYETAVSAKEFLEKQIAFGQYAPAKREPRPQRELKPTIREYWQTFKETYLKTAVCESTASSYETNFKVHILPKLGELRLDEVKAEHMEQFVAYLMVERKLAKATIAIVLREFGRMFTRAIKHKLISDNPASSLGELYSQAPTRHEKIEPLTNEEVPIFLEAVRCDRGTKKHFALFLGAIHTGLRAGELLALEWTDIDWRGGFLSVERSFDRVHRKVVPTKTKKHRQVDLSDELLAALGALRKERLTQWFAKGQKRLITRGLWDDVLRIPKVIFCNEDGGYIDRVNLTVRHYHRCLETAKLKRRRFHDLRQHAGFRIMPGFQHEGAFFTGND